MKAASVDTKQVNIGDLEDKMKNFVLYGFIFFLLCFFVLFGVFLFNDLFGSRASVPLMSDWVLLGLIGTGTMTVLSLIVFSLLMSGIWKPGKSVKVNAKAKIVAPTVPPKNPQ